MTTDPLRPTPGQLAWQQDRMGVFFHFGINTFHGKEWSDGTLPASSFDPAELDARQWVRAAQLAGAKYVVLTAKHHDGFCLWPTATTDYSVASSPWQDGRGDVVAEVAQACREAGLKFGLYLSPWDRNAACYEDAAAYDAFYLAQLSELCTRYGTLHELWFDGAGSEGRVYDWARIGAVIAELQPQAMVFNMGPATIRWVGNEDGLAEDPVEYVVSSTAVSNYVSDSETLDEEAYLPPECDVSLRPGWFWQPAEEPKSLEHLLAIHYRSIGMGANLLLNLPPDSRGLIPDADLARLAEFRAELDRRFGKPMEARLTDLGDGEWELDFGREVLLDHVELGEDLTEGQRVARHSILGKDGEVLAAGLTVGSQRLHAVVPHRARRLRVQLNVDAARLAFARAYDTGGAQVPVIEYTAPTHRPED
ncbi:MULTISPECIES: alpha-L-fucosidase [Arthrobacter]|uniref:alpha-L-fucosidase n=2 Tax=Arthrobacter TaxID=1663 RepID=A0ABU9KMC8_9MICC|nr:alpha-L-fucosidase [Arthrobacter sp. YJM1]MDP5228011.1 alpha-L-fucosidase [Arthrobacter sp. YJM1]